jgi:hypothetical protein
MGKNSPHRKIIGKRKKFENVWAEKAKKLPSSHGKGYAHDRLDFTEPLYQPLDVNGHRDSQL